MKIPNSNRLSYSLMTADDAELLFQLDQDPDVMRYINDGEPNSMQEIQEVYIPRMQSYTNAEKGWGIWKVVVKGSNQFIGWIIVRPMDFFSDSPQWDNLELGWRFIRSSWGKGYATEAAETIKQALIKNGNIKKLSAVAVKENAGSVNIMKKLGMLYIKTDVHHDLHGDNDVVFYEMNATL